jgi:hypothetical protein
MNAQDLKKRYTRSMPDIFGEVLAQADSLLLTAEQVALVRPLQAQHQAHMDSVWSGLAVYLAGLPERYDQEDVFDRIEKDTDEAWEWTRLLVKRDLPKILRPEQLTLLEGYVGRLWYAPGRVYIRIFVN